MGIIIDANVFMAYVIETVKCDKYRTSDTSIYLFENICDRDPIIFDDGGHIRQEWEQLVDPDYWRVWYPVMLHKGCIKEVKCKKLRDELRKITQMGFPRDRDRWYILLALSLGSEVYEPIIISENIHFYDPKCPSKSVQATIKSSSGKLKRYLLKNHGIRVCSLFNYNSII